MLMLCIVICLHGGNYPQNILAEAGDPELNEHQNIKAKFYGLYAMVLDHWFPSAAGYMIHPQWPIPSSHRTIDFVVTFQSNLPGHHSHVLLLVEIKPPWHYHQDAQRQAAIDQVIHCLDEVGPTNNYAHCLYATCQEWATTLCGRSEAFLM